MPSDSKNLKPEQKQIALAAISTNPSKTKDMAEVYRDLNNAASTKNVTEDTKHSINVTNIG